MVTNTTGSFSSQNVLPIQKSDPAHSPLVDISSVPSELLSKANVHGGDGDRRVSSARAGGSYRGDVLSSNQDFTVQVVGAQRNHLVVHRTEQLHLMGATLATYRGASLDGLSLQVHYKGDQGRTFPWFPEKAREPSSNPRTGKDRSLTTEELMKHAHVYASQTIAEPTTRSQFIGTLQQVSDRMDGSRAVTSRSEDRAPLSQHKTTEPTRSNSGIDR